MENDPPEEKKFITNVLDLTALVHELATTCWQKGIKEINPQLVLFAEKYLESCDSTQLIEKFIDSCNKHYETGKYDPTKDYWEKIRERNEVFFAENAHSIFNNLPVDTKNINAFKIFFTAKDDQGNKIIPDDDRNAIWDIFDSLVKISIKYVHRIREVRLDKTEQGLRPVYTNNKFPQIKVRKLAKIWDITLPIPEA